MVLKTNNEERTVLRRNEIITVILAVVTPSLFFTDPAFAELSCSDVNRDNPAYHEKIVNISVK
ncbi:MAG: hypothetical protein HPY65_15525 [Syntrophaceae bacterium]|nr:hypothetical protein [Syntrophaceae bacterium]